MPRGRPKGSKNKPKTNVTVPAPIEKEVIARQKSHAKKHPKQTKKADTYITSVAAPSKPLFDNTRDMLPEMTVERDEPVVTKGQRRVPFSCFDVYSCHRLAKMLMRKYGYTDPSMPKLNKRGMYSFNITEPKGIYNER